MCGFLTESPVAIKLCEFSSINNHHAFMNAVLFHGSIRLIYVPRTSAVWLIVIGGAIVAQQRSFILQSFPTARSHRHHPVSSCAKSLS